MKKLKGLKASKHKIQQTINLKEVFGVDFKGNRSLKEQIGQEVIDLMLNRTESGKDVSGKSFKKYSKSYINSADFEKYGKSANQVNMELKGDMLEDLNIVKMKGNEITIGFDSSLSNKKAANHNQGITVPERQFFGVRQKDLKEIGKKFKDDIKQQKQKEKAKAQDAPTLANFIATNEGQTALDALIQGILSGEG